mgnify:CR=1 FL=1
MKKTNNKTLLSVILSFVLIAVIALTMFGCNSDTTNDTTTTQAPVESTDATKPTTLGEGAVQFSFSVTHKDGTVAEFVINTDKKVVGEALQELGVIAGDMGDYGLYVKTVNGETLDYDKDGMYWAFYDNGAYAAKGVDQTEIVTGIKYEFKAEK